MKEDDRVDRDQLYLAERISAAWGKTLSLSAVQRLNIMFGREIVITALRALHGFPPETKVRDPYAFVRAICESELTA